VNVNFTGKFDSSEKGKGNLKLSSPLIKVSLGKGEEGMSGRGERRNDQKKKTKKRIASSPKGYKGNKIKIQNGKGERKKGKVVRKRKHPQKTPKGRDNLERKRLNSIKWVNLKDSESG